ncbi:MAG: aminoacetone oxidase family FAD-binding enzyme, partial [Nevskiales bacterium]
DFGHRLARQFGLPVLPLRAGLVPFTLQEKQRAIWAELAGVSLPVRAQSKTAAFQENMLFTHRGLSGPAMLQLSSYWQPGEFIETCLLPDTDIAAWLDEQRQSRPRQALRNVLAPTLGKRFTELFCNHCLAGQVDTAKNMADLNREEIETLQAQLSALRWKPDGTEGYRTAEVTLGGVNTDALSSSSFEVITVPGLHFIGEVLDVTGQLGGYNFQWAWASGWCAGQAL